MDWKDVRATLTCEEVKQVDALVEMYERMIYFELGVRLLEGRASGLARLLRTSEYRLTDGVWRDSDSDSDSDK